MKYINSITVFILITTTLLFAQRQQFTNTKHQRVNNWEQKASSMVKYQIEKRGITDTNVLQTMRKTPRHLFVPPALKSMAYDDYPLPIGEEQTISQPYIVALMTELLELKGDEKILEIGTGSGYQSAVLSQIVDTVYTIEIMEPLAKSAKNRLYQLKYSNVVTSLGDGYKGWPSAAPFDGIIVTAAPKEIPQNLVNQLKIGGKMVVPVGKTGQRLEVITKTGKDKFDKRYVLPVRFVPMVHPEDLGK